MGRRLVALVVLAMVGCAPKTQWTEPPQEVWVPREDSHPFEVDPTCLTCERAVWVKH